MLLTKGRIDIAEAVVGPDLSNVHILHVLHWVASPKLLSRNQSAWWDNAAWSQHAAILETGSLQHHTLVPNVHIVPNMAGVQ